MGKFSLPIKLLQKFLLGKIVVFSQSSGCFHCLILCCKNTCKILYTSIGIRYMKPISIRLSVRSSNKICKSQLCFFLFYHGSSISHSTGYVIIFCQSQRIIYLKVFQMDSADCFCSIFLEIFL